MNWDVIEGNWKQYKGQVKAHWGRLSNGHLEIIAGKREQLEGGLQAVYGIDKVRADKQIRAFEKNLKDHRVV